ncbi:methyltransferase [Desertibaculum subflavum]|uniref:methyltransferase n=1 Tax=Desertibaculum subflavum TaxID=2268458 RepID=UPI000E65FE39
MLREAWRRHGVTAIGDRKAGVEPSASTIASAVFVLAIGGLAFAADELALAVYALSWWHYLLYFLAYWFGAIRLAVFRRDAVLMKAAALAVLAAAYLRAPAEPVSLAVVLAGFGLNIAAAAALGVDRTYYGRELDGLPERRVAAFPYSVTAHPMLFGNIAAYAGLLINSEFRATWWPLATMHVVLNLGLLAMETRLAPGRGPADRQRRRRGAALATAAAAGSAIGTLAAAGAALPIAAAAGTAISLYAWLLFGCYAPPAAPTPTRRAGEATPDERGTASQR